MALDAVVEAVAQVTQEAEVMEAHEAHRKKDA
jgi:hypothetical protein